MVIDGNGARKLGVYKTKNNVEMQIAVRLGVAIRDGRILTIKMQLAKPHIWAVRPASEQEVLLYNHLKEIWPGVG